MCLILFDVSGDSYWNEEASAKKVKYFNECVFNTIYTSNTLCTLFMALKLIALQPFQKILLLMIWPYWLLLPG